MPELPEVETTRRGLEPHVVGKTITAVTIRQAKLRWPITSHLSHHITKQKLIQLERRAKYLLFHFQSGTMLMHLGMSGSCRVVAPPCDAGKHDHVDWLFHDGTLMRFNDPRRFGCVLWRADPWQDRLLAHLGPEPFADQFDASYLKQKASGRRVSVKQFIMDQRVVVGVGNIYASEALFMAGIHPKRHAGRVSLTRYARLVEAIKQVLQRAIEAGGTTLKDFVSAEGQPGYFKQDLLVYGRSGSPCTQCQGAIKNDVIQGRNSFYCHYCQQ